MMVKWASAGLRGLHASPRSGISLPGPGVSLHKPIQAILAHGVLTIVEANGFFNHDYIELIFIKDW